MSKPGAVPIHLGAASRQEGMDGLPPALPGSAPSSPPALERFSSIQGFFLLMVNLDSQGRVCLRQRNVETSAEHVVLIA